MRRGRRQRDGGRTRFGAAFDSPRLMRLSRAGLECRFQSRTAHQFHGWGSGGSGNGKPVSLQKQEQIKGPKNAPIARFDGLGCYQTRSEKKAPKRVISWRGLRQRDGGRTRFGVVFDSPRLMRLSRAGLECGFPNRATRRFHGWGSGGSGNGRPVSLQKQEQIKGPENAPIARFLGLGCYQTRSEKKAPKRVISWRGLRQRDGGRTRFGVVFDSPRLMRLSRAGLECGFPNRATRRFHGWGSSGSRNGKPGFTSRTGANSRPGKRPYRTV